MDTSQDNSSHPLFSVEWPQAFKINDCMALEILKNAVTDNSASIMRARIKKIGNLTLNVASIDESVNFHVHRTGEEFYKILEGHGEMQTAMVLNDSLKISGSQINTDKVGPGDVLLIKENQAHSLKNKGDVPLVILFICPESHLIDNGDRHFVEVVG